MNEAEGYEFSEAASLLLDFPEKTDMFRAVPGSFHVSVHDRGRRGNPQAMSGADHTGPIFSGKPAR